MDTDPTAEQLKDLGNKKLADKRFEEAIEYYTKAIALDSNNAVYFTNRATASLNLALDPQNSFPVGVSLAQKAVHDCDKAAQVDQKYAKGYFRRACANIALGRLRDAKSDFEKLAQLEPGNSQMKEKLTTIAKIEQHLHNGSELESRNEWESAARYYDAAIALAPLSMQNKLGVGRCLIGRKMFAEAAKVASAVLQSDPEEVQGLLLRAQAFYGQGEDWTKVGPLVRNLLQLDPDNKEAFALRKRCQSIHNLKLQGNEQFALLKGIRNLDLNEEEREVKKKEVSTAALEAYTAASQVDPENKTLNATLYFNISLVKLELGDKKGALADLDQALSLNPEYQKLYKIRADLNTQLENYQEAVRDYHEASTRDPQSSELKSKLKEAQKRLKESEKKDYYKILELSRGCSDRDIKHAYRKLAMVWHPDKWANASPEEQELAAKKFKDINEANSVLSDPKKRQRFDAGGDMTEGADFADFSEMFRGGGHPFGGFGGFGGGGDPFGGFGGGGHPFGGGRGNHGGGGFNFHFG